MSFSTIEKAAFAGGCFWCMVKPFDELPGIVNLKAGYTGGTIENPTYQDVTAGNSGHFEAVEITYKPALFPYKKLLELFWKQIDPTDPGGQFADRGSSYKTAIFYYTEEQKRLAEQSKLELEENGPFSEPIVTEILPAGSFYPAEDYHQQYYKKFPSHYKRYYEGSGRKAFLEKTWALKKDDEQLKKLLSPLQYEVTQKNGTERPFKNEYFDNKQEGIYVDIVSGEPLFSSTDQYDAGCGWPSFTKPLQKANITERKDLSHFMIRTEVRSFHADSHLGHLFHDGPDPGGLRYCINSAALKFIPKEELEKEGYGEFLGLFNH